MTTKKARYVRKEWGIEVNSCCWEHTLFEAIWESVERLLNNLKIALWYDPSIPYLVNAPKNTIQHATDTCISITGTNNGINCTVNKQMNS